VVGGGQGEVKILINKTVSVKENITWDLKKIER
jgi:hypothetical protein